MDKVFKKRMNSWDKKVLKALNFISEHPRETINSWNILKIPEYKINVPNDIEEYLLNEGYMCKDPNNQNVHLRFITHNGEKYRIDLLKIKYNYDYKWATIIIGIISALAFAKSMGWLGK